MEDQASMQGMPQNNQEDAGLLTANNNQIGPDIQPKNEEKIENQQYQPLYTQHQDERAKEIQKQVIHAVQFQQEQAYGQVSTLILPQQMTQQMQVLQFLSQNPIPDHFSFQHSFLSHSPTFGGRNLESSTFVLPSIGELKWNVDFTMPSRFSEPEDPAHLIALVSRFIPQKAVTLNERRGRWTLPCTNEHFFGQLTYHLQNDKVRIEFFENVGKLYILGILVFELIECDPSSSDITEASMLSTMPQMIVYQPQLVKSDRLRVKAQKNNCPEHPYSLLGYQSIFGCCRKERQFEIYGLKQGTCQVFNRRQSCNACISQCGCRDSFFCRYENCNFVDYPSFEVMFSNVDYVDRLKILFCLVHYSMYNKWEHTGYKGNNLLREMRRAVRLANGEGEGCQLI